MSGDTGRDAAREIEAAVPRAPLEAWLATTLPELGRIIELTKFPGGFSNLTYHLHAERGEAVLRRPPLGAHPVARRTTCRARRGSSAPSFGVASPRRSRSRSVRTRR